MRFLIVSDIHANSIALRWLFSQAERIAYLAWDRVLCLGDIFGYYADPLKTWEVISRWDASPRLGNHDLYLRDMLLHDKAGIGAAESELVAWSIVQHAEMLRRAPLDAQQSIAAFLGNAAQLAPSAERHDDAALIAVHGRPYRNVSRPSDDDFANAYLHPYGTYEAVTAMNQALQQSTQYANQLGAHYGMTLIGHTHMPTLAVSDGERVRFMDARWTTEREDHPVSLGALPAQYTSFLLNGGSVGQPRMGIGHSRTVHALHLDTGAMLARFIKLTIDDIIFARIPAQMDQWQIQTWFDDDMMGRLRQYYVLKQQTAPAELQARFAQRAQLTVQDAPLIWEQQRAELLGTLTDGFPVSPQLLYTYDNVGLKVKQNYQQYRLSTQDKDSS